MSKRENSAAQSSTNKADMSWLLNGGEESKPTVDNERSAKARRSDEPAEPGAQSLHGWLRDAPMLYNLAVNAGIAASAMGAMGHACMDSSTPSDAASSSSSSAPWTSNQRQCEADRGLQQHIGRGRSSGAEQGGGRTLSSSSSSRKTDGLETSAESDTSASEQRRKGWSVSLDESLAIQIYASRPRNAGSKYGSMAEAVRLGEKHGVSPKTIRDIWNRKSWVRVTRAYWTQAEASAYVPRRHRATSPRDAGPGGSPKRRPRAQGKAG